MKIGSIVIRCYEFDKMLAFWQEALHYVPREPAKSGWWSFVIPKELTPTCRWIDILKGVQAKGADCISTSTQRTGKLRLNGSSRWEPLAIHGGTKRATISSSLKIPTVISSVWFNETPGKR